MAMKRLVRLLVILLAAVMLLAGSLSGSAGISREARLHQMKTEFKAYLDSMRADDPICPDALVQTSPLWTPVTTIKGPAVGELWVNADNPDANQVWNWGVQPFWGQALVKIKVNWGQERKYFGVSLVFVEYLGTQACQDRMNSEYQARNLPGPTVNAQEQAGIVLSFDVGRRY